MSTPAMRDSLDNKTAPRDPSKEPEGREMDLPDKGRDFEAIDVRMKLF